MAGRVTDIILTNDNKVLELNYICKTIQASYCIVDFGGNVLIRGDNLSLLENQLSIKELSKGMYSLCIIDGDILTKIAFHKI